MFEELFANRQVTLYQPRSQGLSSHRPSSLASGGGEMRDPGNEVDPLRGISPICNNRWALVTTAK